MGVRVVYGADEEEFNSIIGVEFNSAVGVARDVMGIPSDVTDVRLNGRESPLGTTIIKDGDAITFYKKAGRKGQ